MEKVLWIECIAPWLRVSEICLMRTLNKENCEFWSSDQVWQHQWNRLLKRFPYLRERYPCSLMNLFRATLEYQFAPTDLYVKRLAHNNCFNAKAQFLHNLLRVKVENIIYIPVTYEPSKEWRFRVNDTKFLVFEPMQLTFIIKEVVVFSSLMIDIDWAWRDFIMETHLAPIKDVQEQLYKFFLNA